MLTWPAPYSALPIAAMQPYVAPVDGDFEPILFLSPYYSDQATILADSTASADVPVTLIQTLQPSQRWRSNAATARLTLTFKRAIAANMLVLTGTNLKQMDGIRVIGWSDAALTIPMVDSGWRTAFRSTCPLDKIVRNYSHAIRFTNASEFLYWTVDIVATSGQTYVEAGRLMLGTSYQPVISCDCSDGFSFVPPDQQQLTDFGYTDTEQRGLAVRGATFRFSMMDETDAYGEMLKIRQLRGNYGDFFVDLYPGRLFRWEDTAMQATFKGSADFSPRQLWNGPIQIWGTAVQATEVG